MKFSIRQLQAYIDLKALRLDNHYCLTRECLYNGYPLEIISNISDFTEIVCIISVQKHPNADELNIYTVCDYKRQNHNIICKDLTLESGNRVILAKPGARINNFLIESRKIRGEYSHGMLCSAAELELDYTDQSKVLKLDSTLSLGKISLESLNLIYKAEISFKRKNDLITLQDLANDIKIKYYNQGKDVSEKQLQYNEIDLNLNTYNMILGYIPSNLKSNNKLYTAQKLDTNIEIAGEVARMHGYENIPIKSIDFTFTQSPQTYLEYFRNLALNLGFDEVLCKTISNVGQITLLNNEHKKLRHSFEDHLSKYAISRFNTRMYDWQGIFTFGNCFIFNENEYKQIHKFAILINYKLHKNLTNISLENLVFCLNMILEDNSVLDLNFNVIGNIYNFKNYQIIEFNIDPSTLREDSVNINYFHNDQEFNRDITFTYPGNYYNLLALLQANIFPNTNIYLVDTYQDKITFRIIGSCALNIDQITSYYIKLGEKYKAVYNI